MGIYSQEIEINKRDKQRSKYLKYALAEDKLIAALLKNNDYYKYIIERIIPEDVVTDSNRKIFAAITKHLSENRSTELISFSEELDDELISRMSWLLAESEGKRFDLAEVDDYIDRIKSFKLKKDDTQLAEMSSAEFDDYIRNLADKKRK